MRHEHVAADQPHEQVLAAPVEALDGGALQPVGDLDGVERRHQPLVEHPHLLQPAALQERREAAADGLDLGQLGHRREGSRIPPRQPPGRYPATASASARGGPVEPRTIRRAGNETLALGRSASWMCCMATSAAYRPTSALG